GEHVVDRRQLAVVHPGVQDVVADQCVPDDGALQVRRVDDVGEVLDLVHDGVEAHRLGAGVVDQVRGVAGDEPRLHGRRDLRLRLHGRLAAVQVGEDVGGELDVVHAVAAVEDHRLDRRVRFYPEWVVRVHVPAGFFVTAVGGLVVTATAPGGARGEGDAERHRRGGVEGTA